MVDVNLSTPTGDDQEWKRQVAEALKQLAVAVDAASTQIGQR
jgi:hypothetical protein